MPALQVRDFPDELYEQLKVCAERNHRSMAQQTIVAVEQMIATYEGTYYWDGKTLHRPSPRARVLSFDTEAERAARIKKREEIIERARSFKWKGRKPTGDEIVAMVREGREERERQLEEVMRESLRGATL